MYKIQKRILFLSFLNRDLLEKKQIRMATDKNNNKNKYSIR